MERNERFLDIAKKLAPVLFEKRVGVQQTLNGEDYRCRTLRKGDTVCLDFGNHMVGKVTLKLGFTGPNFSQRIAPMSSQPAAAMASFMMFLTSVEGLP